MESQSDYSTRGCLLGKTVSPRLQQLEDDFMDNGGCFKEFKIGDLFYKLNLRCKKKKFDKKKDISTSKSLEYSLPLVNAKNGDNGVMYYGRFSDWESADYCIDIINDGAVSTGNVYPQPQKTGVLYNAYLIKGIDESFHNEFVIIYIAQALQKSIKLKYGYDNKATWEKVKNNTLTLPSINDLPCTKFMESYIRELEQERIRVLDAYLKATGLNDYELTSEEKNSIEIMQNGGKNYKEFKVLDIFSVKNTQSIMKSQVGFCSGDIPYVTAGETNNSIASYISAEPSIIDKGNCIVIGGKSTVVTYQEQDFVSNDSHNLALYMKETNKKSKYTQMFFVTLLSFKLKQLYNWGNSISNKKIQKDTIHVPVNQNGDIDYQFIELYSKAVEKICIKSVVDWKDRIIQTTKNVVNC